LRKPVDGGAFVYSDRPAATRRLFIHHACRDHREGRDDIAVRGCKPDDANRGEGRVGVSGRRHRRSDLEDHSGVDDQVNFLGFAGDAWLLTGENWSANASEAAVNALKEKLGGHVVHAKCTANC
jgi:hypothetical protein